MSANRRLPRSQVRSSLFPQYSPHERDTSIGSDEHQSNSNGLTYPPPPKHVPFPDVPQQSDALNEFFMFAYTALAAGLQFLHLYRTVWWLPDSYTNQTMNFYLIDPYLATFIFLLLGRRFFYCIINKLCHLMCPRKFHQVQYAIKLLFIYGVIAALVLLCAKIYEKQSFIVIYLCYPIIVYILTFGLTLKPFFRTTFEADKSNYLNGAPLHCCSINPSTVRSEIDSLKSDYNNRFKQVIFTSLLNAYYVAFIPCCFAQSFLFYDIFWATQYLGFILLGGLTMCTMFCFPANYCDVLHRAALHLGQWTRVESRSHLPPAATWSKLIVWPSGSMVRHGGELFKASGQTTTAIPGNGVHSRFYLFFQNPAYLYCILSILQICLIIVQLTILFFTIEWHNIISMSFLLLANYFTLFKSIRDYFVTYRIYSAESSTYDKLNNGTLANNNDGSSNGSIGSNASTAAFN